MSEYRSLYLEKINKLDSMSEFDDNISKIIP